MTDYFRCAVCGTRLPMDAEFCPECYSDAETGWSEDAKYDGLLPYDPDEDRISRSIYPSNSISKIIYAAIAIFTVISFLLYAVNGNPIMIPFALGMIALAYFWSKKSSSAPEDLDAILYKELLNKAQGDKALVERWIEYEKSRRPNLTRQEWIEDALYRWKRDNR